MRRWVMVLALIATVLAIYSMLPKPEAETLRAPECFDGTPPPKGCPSWAYDPIPEGKAISHFDFGDDGIYYTYYTDGTKAPVDRTVTRTDPGKIVDVVEDADTIKVHMDNGETWVVNK